MNNKLVMARNSTEGGLPVSWWSFDPESRIEINESAVDYRCTMVQAKGLVLLVQSVMKLERRQLEPLERDDRVYLYLHLGYPRIGTKSSKTLNLDLFCFR